jgi:chromosomal replication initiator protein
MKKIQSEKKQSDQATYIANNLVGTDYTFDNFIAGSCNQDARNHALSIAGHPTKITHNPFVIYGKTGLGKSHLLQAVMRKIRDNHPGYKILNIPSETFCAKLVDATRNQRQSSFLKYFSRHDMFILEDLNYFEGKPVTQRFLKTVMDRFLKHGKQIILSISLNPYEIKEMDSGLLSRISKGMLVELTIPDSQTMFSILVQKVKQSEVSVPEPILKALASNSITCIRETEGILITAIAKAKSQEKEISIELLNSILRKFGLK